MRSNSLSPVRLSLVIGLTALVVAAAVTLGAKALGEPFAPIVLAPGVFVADVIGSLWPEARGGGASTSLPRTCNIAVLSLLLFGLIRSWAFRRRRG